MGKSTKLMTEEERKYYNEYHKEYGKNEKVREYQKRYREEHKEYFKNYMKEYRQKNIDRLRAYSRDYYKGNTVCYTD